jgi:hypothetical protein
MFPTPDFPLSAADFEKDSWEKLALALANLPPREFWIRRRGPFTPAKKRTLDLPDMRVTPQVEAAVRELMEISGRLYGGARQIAQDSPAAPVLHGAKRVADQATQTHSETTGNGPMAAEMVMTSVQTQDPKIDQQIG